MCQKRLKYPPFGKPIPVRWTMNLRFVDVFTFNRSFIARILGEGPLRGPCDVRHSHPFREIFPWRRKVPGTLQNLLPARFFTSSSSMTPALPPRLANGPGKRRPPPDFLRGVADRSPPPRRERHQSHRMRVLMGQRTRPERPCMLLPRSRARAFQGGLAWS